MSDELRETVARAQHGASGFGVIRWTNLTERERNCWRESADAVLTALQSGGWEVRQVVTPTDYSRYFCPGGCDCSCCCYGYTDKSCHHFADVCNCGVAHGPKAAS